MFPVTSMGVPVAWGVPCETDRYPDKLDSLLEMDVAATIGGNHSKEIAAVAWPVRVFADTPDEYEQRVVDDLQQWFHDAFFDTSWPNCPDHPHHPLWFSHGWWRCEESERRVAKLRSAGHIVEKNAGPPSASARKSLSPASYGETSPTRPPQRQRRRKPLAEAASCRRRWG